MKIIQITATVLAIILLSACSKKAADATTATSKDTTPPVLSVPFIDTSLVIKFINFGGIIHGSDKNDNYEIYVSDRTSNVYASAAGVVTEIIYNVDQTGDSNFYQQDYEIHIKPNANSAWALGYDHVRNVTVKVGDQVTAGQVLGNPGKISSDVGTEGRTELTVYQTNDENKSTSYCPKNYGDTTFNAGFDTAITKHNAAYPSATLSTTCEVESL